MVKNAVEGEVKIERIYCSSDSQVALWWVKSDNKLWEAWVQWRVEKIRKNVGKDVWWYVKTNKNPADIGTREKSWKLLNENVWKYGAEFLYNNESQWPPQEFIISKVDDEMKKKSNRECILTSKVETSELGLGNIIDVTRYGSLQKLLRITAYVKRFVRNVRSKKIGGEVVLKMLTADDIEEALRLWIIYEQGVLMKNGNFEKLRHLLDVYRDDKHLLRVKSRITEAIELDYHKKYPYYARNHYLQI